MRRLHTLIAFIAILLTSFVFAEEAFASTTPYRVQVSSETDSAFTISWVTTTAETGHVEFGTSAGSLTTTVYDSRGASTSSTFHHVQVTGLSANTTYYWRIVSGGTGYGDPDASGSPYQHTTGPSLILLGSNFIAGKVYLTNGVTPAADVLVHVTLRDADSSGSSGSSQTRTVLSDSNGEWLLSRESFRTADLQGGFTISSSGDDIEVVADAGVTGRVVTTVDSSWSSSSPTTINQTLAAPGAPTVTDVSPASGTNTVSTDVTITGTEFLFATSAALSDASATSLTGFSVDSDTQISATVPSGVTAGTYDVRVTTPQGTNTTSSVKFSASTPPEITSSILAQATEDESYSHTLTVSGGAAPFTWSLFSGSLPSGLSLAANGEISGTPAANGIASFTVKVIDNSGVSDTASVSLTIADPVSVPSGTVTDATRNRSYGPRTLSTIGGTTPVTWTVTGLPPGMTATPSGRSVNLGGTPTTDGTYSVSITVDDANGSSATTARTIVVNAPVSAPVGSLPTWTAGMTFSPREITTTGGTGTITWTVTGLPQGMTTSTNGGTLTVAGTPASAGTYTVTASAADSNGSTASTIFSLTVNAPLTSVTGSLPDWTQAIAYSQRTLSTTGGTGAVTWSVTGLPPGLAAAAADRSVSVSGTPSAVGTYQVNATATDSIGSSVSLATTLVIAAPPSTPAGTLVDWTQGVPYAERDVSVTGGTAPLTWTTTGLPTGMTATPSGSTVTFAGTPSVATSSSIVITVTDAVGATSTRTIDITINPALSALAGTLPDWTQGLDYGTRTISTTGGTTPLTWTATGVPSGLATSASTGRSIEVLGTPSAAGSYTLVLTATDAAGASVSNTYTIAIAAPLTQPTGLLPDWTIGRDYGTRTLATTGGTLPITWEVSGLPDGLDWAPDGRELDVSGAATQTGTFTVAVQVTDAAGAIATESFAVTINPPVTAPAGALASWTVGRPYATQTLTTTGGTEAISWSATGLPSGLTLAGSGRSATLTGTPSTVGTFDVTVQVTDAAGSTSQQAYSIDVNPQLTAPTGSLPAWTRGQSYATQTLATTGGTDPISWQVTGLPPGMSSVASGRSVDIAGTPSSSGDFDVRFVVTDAAGSSAERTVVLAVAEPVTVPISALIDWTVGRPYGDRATTTTGGTEPITWTINGLPAGLTVATEAREATVSGTPSASGTFSVSMTATDAAGSVASVIVPVRINDAVTAPTGVLPEWTAGQDYGQHPFTTTGGTAPLSWEITGLPGGLYSMASVSGITVVGTPALAGVHTVRISVTDAAGSTASSAVPLLINGPLAAPVGSLPDWTEGVDYRDRVLTTAGGTLPLSWQVIGLPDGLTTSFSGREMTVSGTPSAAGSYEVMVRVTDAAGATALRVIPISISRPLTAPSGSLVAWTVGQSYPRSQLTTTGGTPPLNWNVTGLPAGMMWSGDERDLLVDGMPAVTGTFDVQVAVLDDTGALSTTSYSLTINPRPTQPSGDLPHWTVGQTYGDRVLSITGGTAPYVWQTWGLPPGLSATGDGQQCVITGTPTNADLYAVAITVTDAAGASETHAWPLMINSGLDEASGSFPAWTRGQPYGPHEFTVAGGTNGSGGPHWTVSGLPPGLSAQANGYTCSISGTPTTAGTFTVQFHVEDDAGDTSTASHELVINRPVAITQKGSLPAWTAGVKFDETLLTTGGTAPFTWEITGGGVPGISLNSETGLYSGDPSFKGAFEVTFRVRDAAGSTDESLLAFQINDQIDLTDDRLPFATEGIEYSYELVFKEGTPPFLFELDERDSPSWMRIENPSVGVLSGQPQSHGESPVVIHVTDASNNVVTKVLGVKVATRLDIVDAPKVEFTMTASAPPRIFALDTIAESSMTIKVNRPDGEKFEGRLYFVDEWSEEVKLTRDFSPKPKGKSLVASAKKLPSSARRFLIVDPDTAAQFTARVDVATKFRKKFKGTLRLDGVRRLDVSAPRGATLKLKLNGRGGVDAADVRLVHLSEVLTDVPIDGNRYGPTIELLPLSKWGDFWGELDNAVTSDGEVKWVVNVKVPKPGTSVDSE